MQGGGGQGAYGTGTGAGGMANVYAPRGQPTADWNYGQQIQPLLNTALAGSTAVGDTGSPSALAYLQSRGIVDQGLTNNPTAGTAVRSAQDAYNYGVGQLFPQATAGSSALHAAAQGGLPYAGAALRQGFDPRFQEIANAAANDPYGQMAVGGALQGARLGAQGAQGQQDLALSLGGVIPRLFGISNQMAGTIDPLIQSGFDPQSALFNRSQAQLMDQTSAINAMSGLSGTPYGAGAMSKALSDFDIDWQSKQLGRQVQAAGAAGNAAGAAGQALGQAGNLGTQAGNLYGQAPGLAATSAGLPSVVYHNDLRSQLAALGARNQAGLQGVQGYGSMLGSTGTGLQQAQGIGGTGASTLAALGAAPYNTGAGIANNALQGINQQTNLGNSAFDQSNKQLANLLSYMTGGRQASELSGQLGQQGFNQTASGISGLTQGLGMAADLAMMPFGVPPVGSIARGVGNMMPGSS